MIDWWFIESAPKNSTWIEVKLKDGTIHKAHWASDLSGEEQPPFQGWFVSRPGCSGFYQIETPEFWRSLRE